MGNFFSSPTVPARRSKRKRNDDSSSEDSASSSPKRKKLTTTSQYIYRTLFLEGQNSDVTIVALGIDWRLHKVYLCQTPYFASMFTGGWKETEEGIVEIGIEDPRITPDALKTVFGALYLDEVVISADDAVPVLATATLFQMDDLITLCSEIMEESISLSTVLLYYNTALEYGSVCLKKKCCSWLEENLMQAVNQSPKTLRNIEVTLMRDLVESPRLVVIQTEFSLYLLLLVWVYLRNTPAWDGEVKDAVTEAKRHFKERPESCTFLETEDGEDYTEVFQALRLENLIIHPQDVEALQEDNVIPMSMLDPVFRRQWCSMLRVDQGLDLGPRRISEEQFNKFCHRCGRVLTSDTRNIWRWTGYNFGMDIVVTYQKKVLKFRRNDWNEPEALRLPPSTATRNIFYRVAIYSIKASGEATLISDSGIQMLSLARQMEKKVLVLKNDDVKFPLIVSASWLTITPPNEDSSAATASD
ncbi:germ cell-less protein-like 1 [Ornithodoros turicata]|uniref:germ cell-less protein-like 1 n=1 Tax=Ornithodoros turicata TaxID=34597 RepID=UPI00313A3600